MKLSIIIPTLGREQEFESLLISIKNSRVSILYEVIVVDQNEDGLIDEICETYQSKLPLMQYKVQFKGPSKARNFGVRQAKGDVVCFPDDDAEFTEETIENAVNVLCAKNVDCVFGKCIDKNTKEDSIQIFKSTAVDLNLNNFENAFVEATMFAYRALLEKYPFDEEMGVGRIYGAQEGYDLVYRMLCDGVHIYYTPEILFYHPCKIMTRTSDAEVKRAFYYSCGLGYLCRKHNFKNKYTKRKMKLFFGIPIIAMIRHKELKYYIAQWMGLELGYKYL